MSWYFVYFLTSDNVIPGTRKCGAKDMEELLIELADYIVLQKRAAKKELKQSLEGGDKWKKLTVKIETYDDLQCFLDSRSSPKSE